MPVSRAYADYVVEQLAGLRDVQTRRMFGGMGLYAEDVFFALIDDDVLYFKVSAATAHRYVAAGSTRFAPDPARPMNYYSVPAAVLEDAEELTAWAREAIAVGRLAAPRKRAQR